MFIKVHGFTQSLSYFLYLLLFVAEMFSSCKYICYDRPCGLVVRVSGYRYRGPGFDPRRYQIF